MLRFADLELDLDLLEAARDCAHEILREHAEGLIGTTTCIGSEINQCLLQGDYEKAKRTAEMYKEIFGHDSFFVELQDHKLKEQEIMKV